MATFNLRQDFAIQKGPLTQQEALLKDFLVRDTVFAQPSLSLGGVTAGNTTGGASIGPAAPPAAAQPSGGDLIITQLGLVQPGDLITADFMNGVVRTLNQLIAYLRNQSAAAPPAPTTQPAATAPTVSTATGVVGLLKDVVITPAAASDKVTITFPAQAADQTNFSDILVGTTRVDPAELVKTDDGRLSFQVDKAAITAGTDVRAVSKPGVSGQQVVGLFK